MSKVYVVTEDGNTKELTPYACVNEDKDLQRLLEQDLNLIPSNQITAGKDLRWLLIKREMPVPTPSSGDNLWSIDFLLADQDGVPTFVECKRKNDSRSRREVVGQMLEYAANGRHYWDAKELVEHAVKSAGGTQVLTERLKRLTDSDATADEYFALVEKHLQQSKLRLIFFLEESPYELRSIVEFLNGQTKDMEILIVEARQYQNGNERILVPRVFGFTEAARVAKKESKKEIEQASLVKGEPAFWEGLQGSSAPEDLKLRVREFIESIQKMPNCEVSFQRSCLLRIPELIPGKPFVSIYRSGLLELSLAALDTNGSLQGKEEAARKLWMDEMVRLFDVNIDKSYRQLSPGDWMPKLNELLGVIQSLLNLTATLPRDERDARLSGFC